MVNFLELPQGWSVPSVVTFAWFEWVDSAEAESAEKVHRDPTDAAEENAQYAVVFQRKEPEPVELAVRA
ncbi:hypothetical protein ISS86_02135 [Candidatus Microgenomates bacterium]|nr:hypothetical protein [Candidatus Microgenomates bacterium]